MSDKRVSAEQLRGYIQWCSEGATLNGSQVDKLNVYLDLQSSRQACEDLKGLLEAVIGEVNDCTGTISLRLAKRIIAKLDGEES